MKRIGDRLQDGIVPVLLTLDEWQGMRELPPPPVCMICGKPDAHLIPIGYGSQYDGDFICPEHLDEAIDLLKAKKGGE